MIRPANKFRRGSGCFKCGSCTRQTRDTGDNGSCGLCPECYEIAGMENGLSDNASYWTPEQVAESEMEIARLKAEVIRKGGKL